MNIMMFTKQVRLALLVALAIAAVLAALLVSPSGAYAQPAGPYSHICHADGSGGWEYTVVTGPQEVWIGHFNPFHHSGDIIPPFVFLGTDLQTNWDVDHWTIWTNNCEELLEPAPTPVDPVEPGFVEATCESEPYATFQGPFGAVTYSWDVTPAPGVTVTFLATLAPSEYLYWGDIGNWSTTSDPNVLTQSHTFAVPDCPTPAEPETPPGTAVPSPTAPATETPTTTGSPLAITPETPTIAVTTPPAASDPLPQDLPAVTGLPDTGTGEASSPVGTVLIVAALGVAAVGGIALVIGDRKRA